MVTADPLTLCRVFVGMGELSGKTNKVVKRLFQVKLTFLLHSTNPATERATKNRLGGRFGW